MFHRFHWLACLCLGTVLLTVNCSVAGPRKASVPPARELEILDPGVDPLGLPTVLAGPGENGLKQITIPPTVIVHKYYYSGDRSFRGPNLPGGPTILVVTHPKTGEQCRLEVNLLPGSPRIHYSAKTIQYDYGKQQITLRFCTFGRPRIEYKP